MKKILLSQGKVALVDDKDYPEIVKYNWFYMGNGYAVRNNPRRNGKRSQTYMHHAILGKPSPSKEVDHKNRNRLDNRRSNLRFCTAKQNQANQVGFPDKPNRSSQYKGVHWFRLQNCWRTMVYYDGKSHHIGCYKSEEEAALAYNKEAVKQWGEFAYLNPVSG